jgi:anti-sigma B factor antagonist
MDEVAALKFGHSIARQSPECYVVSLCGEVDLFVAPLVSQAFATVARHGATQIVLDLGETEFIDSTVLGLVTRELRRLRGLGGMLVLACDDPRILRPFELTGMDKLVPVASTLAEGIALCRASGDDRAATIGSPP